MDHQQEQPAQDLMAMDGPSLESEPTISAEDVERLVLPYKLEILALEAKVENDSDVVNTQAAKIAQLQAKLAAEAAKNEALMACQQSS
jgi:CII-binding regulator of phage lambda lysogenization HflD